MLTERQRAIYVAAGVALQKAVIVPNFLPQDLDPGSPPTRGRSGYTYVGRLSPEKGVVRLLQRWPETVALTVLGDDPLRPTVEALAARRPNTAVVGGVSRSTAIDAMRRSRWLLFPSHWLEELPKMYLEALACGLPTLAFEPSVLAEGREARRHRPQPGLGRSLARDRLPIPRYCRHCARHLPSLLCAALLGARLP